VLLWASLPPLDLGWLAWIAPVPWLLLVRRPELKPLDPPEPTWLIGTMIAGVLVGYALALGLVWALVLAVLVSPFVHEFRRKRRPYVLLWLVGFVFWLSALHWLRLPHWATSLGWIALSFYFAFYLPVFIGLSRIAVHRLRVPLILAAPVVWTGLELARAHLLTGFTMASLGHTQYRWIELIQISDLAGAFGVSFVVMLAAACLARMAPLEGSRWTFWPLAPMAAVLTAVLVYGYQRTSIPPPKPEARIALIQGSIDITLKSDPGMRDVIHEHYEDLSREAARKYGRLDLIVWPETMLRDALMTVDRNARVPPDWTDDPEEFRFRLARGARRSEEQVGRIAASLGAPMIVGIDRHHFGPDRVLSYNSAAYLSGRGKLLGYGDKFHLVMFGEYVPFASRLPWLQRLTPLPISLAAGEKPAAFDVGKLRAAPNICYESVLPHVIRRQVGQLAAEGREPDVLVNLTNDGWFWGSSELDMHLICGVFRAVECRKPFLIAANTGFSAWIDAEGRILAQGKRREPDTLLAEVGHDPRTSWYLTVGDWPAGLCLTAAVAFGLVGLWDWRKRRSASL